MTKGKIEIDLEDLKRFGKQLEYLRNNELEKFIKSTTKNLAQRISRRAINKTPVVSGKLRGAWEVKGKETSDGYEVTIFNSIEYAAHVEYGHRQNVGQYVPVLGKRLKNPWVEGKFMLTKSELEVEEKIEQIIQEKLEKWLEKIFNG